MASTGIGDQDTRADAENARDAQRSSGAVTIIAAIVILLVYQGYSLSVVGVASPWIAKSFALDQAELAELFAWMSLSAFGALILARLADRVGRRRIILTSLVLAPLCALGAALARRPAPFALFEILISALLGGSVSSAIVLLAEELPVEERARGQAFAACASAVGGVLGYIVIPFLLQWEYSWRWLLAPCIAGIGLVFPAGTDAAGRLAMGAAGVDELRFRQPLLRHFSSALSASRDHAFGVRRARHDCRQRGQRLALFRCGFDNRTFAAKSEFRNRCGHGPRDAGFSGGRVGFRPFRPRADGDVRGGAAWFGAFAFYWGPPNGVTWPLAWLVAAYCWFKIASGVMTVGANSAATELFPAGLRTTMIGWQGITAAAFSMLAQVMIAALIGPLGGLANVIRYLALLGIPSAAIFGTFIDETRGLPLEVAAKEEAWARAKNFPGEPPMERASAGE